MKNSLHFPIDVEFNYLKHSKALENHAIKHAHRLEKYFPRIMGCTINIVRSGPHNNGNHKGKIYHVTVNLIVPGAKLVANRDSEVNHKHEDPYVALTDAFLAITAQLKKYVQKQRGDVKHHEYPTQGLIREIAPLADYGFIETIDGRRLRFTSKSVVGDSFEKLEIGNRVAFVEALSNDGPSASTVYIQ